MTETTENVWGQVDAWINEYLDAHPADYYFLTHGTMAEIVEASKGALGIVNKIGLKRKVGKILKIRGYFKISTYPPKWVRHPEKPVREIPDWAQDTYRCLLESELWISRAKDELIKQFPDMDSEARQ
jgi:hypothetical protein